ncbi:MAG: DegT/DnrJ/EryC1/StrS family aminotransferase [Planctomycetaceae bacterium]|nr:DegT/DnrJ/EryC1/StrS family aminotransferase [Planctomycetaceae bacterium]
MTTHISDLGNIPLARPDITESEIEAVAQVLRSDRLSIGPHIELFEQAVAHRASRKHGIGVNSGTSGLHLCVRGMGIGEGDEVITSPFSFIATTNCILFERATPIFVDIDIETYNMDPQAVEAAITPRTKAILPVEAFGNVAHFQAYDRIARKHKLLLIEDCCEALGGSLEGRPAGSFGDCGVFGFYPNKQVTTGEGGVIVTDNDELAEACRSMRNQGRSSENANVFTRLGYNYRLTEVAAALGERQMLRLDDILHQRRLIARMYNEMLAPLDIHLPPCPDIEHASWFAYVIRLPDRFSASQRDKILDHLNARGIAVQAYFPAIHLQPYIQELLGIERGDFPVCECVADRTIVLPFFVGMTPEMILRIVEELKKTLAG